MFKVVQVHFAVLVEGRVQLNANFARGLVSLSLGIISIPVKDALYVMAVGRFLVLDVEGVDIVHDGWTINLSSLNAFQIVSNIFLVFYSLS